MKLRFLLWALWTVVFFCGCINVEQNHLIPVSVDYKNGERLFDTNRDSAFYYFNNVATGSKDDIQASMAYTYLAIIQSDAGDYFGSQESLLMSLKCLESQSNDGKNYLYANYNELGNTSLNLKNYNQAINYYNQALKYAKDRDSKIIALSNKAVALQKIKQYKEALAIFETIIGQCANNPKRYARILSNMTRTKWLKDPSYNATPELWDALSLRENIKDNWGLNASYSHLSDYYTVSQPDSALVYANKMYAVAQQLNSPDDEQEALQKIIVLDASPSVKKYFTRYQYLNDSLQTARNSAKNQFALIRYEAAKNKADNLALQKDNAEKKIQIISQWITIASVLVLVVIAFIWYRKRKQQILHEQQLKTSKKVHDTIANGIYSIMSEVEHSDVLEREQLLDRLDIVYERSRNISYELKERPSDDFHSSIARLLRSFSSPSTAVSIVGNTKDVWKKITPTVQKELEHILQELMVNMKKHSAAKNVAVKFEDTGTELKIQYIDDGIGLPTNFKYGNGLSNTENRMAGIGGKITFDTSTELGLKVLMLIPIV